MKLFSTAVILVCAVGCGGRGARTPAEAHARLTAAVAAHDGAKLWDALDQDTRWSWMTIQRAWREAYDITQSVVPEGRERARLLTRFEPGATSENAGVLFARTLSEEEWRATQALLAASGGATPALDATGERATLATSAGPLVYRKAQNRHWGWGFAGLAARAEETKRLASADLERMRNDAADYERAAARGMR